jgi:predicted DNA-binding transcriptional regulator AlpA
MPFLTRWLKDGVPASGGNDPAQSAHAPHTGRPCSLSDMTIYRWRHDPKLDFPKPVEIRGRLYFDEAALDAFDKAHRTSVVT